MSNALALAAVTAVLKSRLDNALAANSINTKVGGPVTVSALAPDRIPTGDANGTAETIRLNLFLYRVAPNLGWSNNGLPSRDAGGARLTNPPLALDLSYLLTAYGPEDFQAEILLGFAMQLLHEVPFLTRDTIRTALAPPGGGAILPPALQALSASDLADQVEQIKISPQPMSIEEISKLWSAFQTHYRPTAAYQASTVLIQSTHSTRPTLTVRERRIHVVPFRRPAIEAVAPQMTASGGQLTLTGQNLQGKTVKVRFGSVVTDPDEMSEGQLKVTLPAGLQAGINTLQVVYPLDFGTPGEPHGGFESNVAAFMLTPRITTPAPISAARGATLSLSVAPPVARAQEVRLLAGDRSIVIPARPAVDPPTVPHTEPAPSPVLQFPIPSGFPAGTFLLRVEVDGAQSPLEVDTTPASPTFGQYVGPTVAVT
jgi:hypothetical protein